MATRFSPAAQQYPGSPNMRPGYMRLNSSQDSLTNGNGSGPPPVRAGPGPNGGGYPMAGRQPSGGSGARKPERKDTKEVAWVHWRALKDFLTAWGDKESPTARASAREKLTRLTRLQFLELSTDVYDELMRRLASENGSSDGAVAPFLPVRDDFHPKRNQARQKLATLPKNRFKDLASDVFFELRRRYPEFESGDGTEPPEIQEMLYDEGQSPKPYGGGGLPPSSSSSSLASATASRQNSQPGHHRKGSSIHSNSSVERSASVNASRDRYANLTTPTNDVVVPNKSRLQEEAIEVPYARDSHHEEAQGLLSMPQPQTQPQSHDASGHRPESRSSAPTSQSHDIMSPTGSDAGYADHMSFSSHLTSTAARNRTAGSAEWEEQEHKLRAEYELRIAGLERKVQGLESERDDLQRELADLRERHRDYEDEVRGLKERATGHASSLRSIQAELDRARDSADALKSEHDQRSRQAAEEIATWRERCEGLQDELHRLETERADRATREATERKVTPLSMGAGETAELQAEMRSLVEELQALSVQNDDLLAERERDRETQAALEAKVEEYKKQANATRIELRNLKATSTMFVAQPLSNDHLPASADGNIADVNVSAFQSGIDGLLAAARSSQPSGVLPAMKAVVEAVTSIGDDVKAFEDRPNLDVDVSRLEMLKYESTTRLSGLMTAARNHAMASGLSPVSLIDGAAGHLSTNVVEIIKLLKIRRTGSTRELIRQPGMSIGDMVRRKSGVYASIDEGDEDAMSSPKTRYSPLTVRSPAHSTSPLDRRSPSHSASPLDRHSPAHATRPLDRRPSDGYAPLAGSSERRPSDFSTHSASPVAERRPLNSSTTTVNAVTPTSPRGYGTQAVGGGSPSRSYNSNNNLAAAPPSAYEAPEFRIKSFQSGSSSTRSDTFDLERKGSVTSAKSDYNEERNPFTAGATTGLRLPSAGGPAPPVPAVTVAGTSPEIGNVDRDRDLPPAPGSEFPSYFVSLTPANPFGYKPPSSRGTDAEWDELKPYLNAQSSALVNSIQNLLAAIRTGGQGPALNEHLSEVIAVSSSIVGVCRASLPPRLRGQGEPLLADLVGNTDRLSEAQQAAARAGGFDKALRQGIASASFGVAKALKALMKVGGTD